MDTYEKKKPGNKEGGNKMIRTLFQARKVATEKDPTDLSKIITWICVFSDEKQSVEMCGFYSIGYRPNKRIMCVWLVSLLETTVHEGDPHLHNIQKADAPADGETLLSLGRSDTRQATTGARSVLRLCLSVGRGYCHFIITSLTSSNNTFL